MDPTRVSAGFDRHARDRGALLSTEDDRTVSRWVAEAARERCRGRHFAVLEGGYDAHAMAEAAAAYAEGAG